jgi:hypothetical protein
MFADGGAFPPPPKPQKTPEEKAAEDAQTAQAAGVQPEDDDETKQKKIQDYQASQSKPVAAMSAAELSAVIHRSNMAFFRKTGGNPAKPTVEDEGKKGLDPFEQRIHNHLAAGAKNKGVAIMRARRDAPAEYNAYRAKQNKQQNLK